MSRSYPKAYRRKTDINISLISFLVIAITAYAHQAVVIRTSVFALIVAIAAYAVLKSRCWISILNRSTSTSSMAQIDKMTGLEFEQLVVTTLKKQNYTDVRLTEKYDLGVDIMAIKSGVCWGIQVKRSSGLVKADAVRQAVTALNKYGCDRSMVVTNSAFSKVAETLAVSNNCVLIDRAILKKWLSTLV